MNEEQQIEEMAKIMCGNDCEECAKESAEFYNQTLEEARNNKCLLKNCAKTLYEQGYRKLPEDSVVLSREELSEEPYNDFCKGCPNVRVRSSGMTDCCADYSCKQFQKYARLLELYKQSRKETAREILREIRGYYPVDLEHCDKGEAFILELCYELANKYGVEIKE